MREFLTLFIFGGACMFAGSAVTYTLQTERVLFRNYPVFIRIPVTPAPTPREAPTINERSYA